MKWQQGDDFMQDYSVIGFATMPIFRSVSIHNLSLDGVLVSDELLSWREFSRVSGWIVEVQLLVIRGNFVRFGKKLSSFRPGIWVKRSRFPDNRIDVCPVREMCQFTLGKMDVVERRKAAIPAGPT